MHRSYFALIIMPVLVTAGQLLLKKNAAYIKTGQGLKAFIGSILRPGIILAAVLVLSAPLLYLYALEEVPLYEAFAFNSLNYVFVFISGRLLLKENITVYQGVGVGLISAGFLFPFIIGAAGA